MLMVTDVEGVVIDEQGHIGHPQLRRRGNHLEPTGFVAYAGGVRRVTPDSIAAMKASISSWLYGRPELPSCCTIRRNWARNASANRVPRSGSSSTWVWCIPESLSTHWRMLSGGALPFELRRLGIDTGRPVTFGDQTFGQVTAGAVEHDDPFPPRGGQQLGLVADEHGPHLGVQTA